MRGRSGGPNLVRSPRRRRLVGHLEAGDGPVHVGDADAVAVVVDAIGDRVARGREGVGEAVTSSTPW